MKILVCGGAGYIGSHTVAELIENGYKVVVIDNLESGHIDAIWHGAFIEIGDLRDLDFTDYVFRKHKIDAVIDFAAYSVVGESVKDPLKYYQNNVYSTLCLLDAMKRHNVLNIVFSSTAAIYGEPKTIPILENDDAKPVNPYGETKLSVEKMLKWFDNAYGIKYSALRYFNVAGAHISGRIGEDHRPETHLVPNVLKVALGQTESLSLFGDDYDTFDGTCIRDYVHVTDLAAAHILALNYIVKNQKSIIYNLGNGRGFSNREIINTAIKVTGKNIKTNIALRRTGDPPVLVASSDRIINELDWCPKYNSLEKIIETAWNWHKNNPNGYNS